MPPPCRNQRDATGSDTPTAAAAFAVASPPAISRQNARCTARDGSARPGDRIGARSAQSDAHCRRAPAGTSGNRFLGRPIAHLRDRGNDAPLVPVVDVVRSGIYCAFIGGFKNETCRQGVEPSKGAGFV